MFLEDPDLWVWSHSCWWHVMACILCIGLEQLAHLGVQFELGLSEPLDAAPGTFNWQQLHQPDIPDRLHIVACWVYHATNNFTLSRNVADIYCPPLIHSYNHCYFHYISVAAIFQVCLWWRLDYDSCLSSDTLSSSRKLGLYRCSADRIRDTIHQGSISRVRQSVALEISHLIRCYSTDNPLLRFVAVGTQQFPL
jgi:hypothetical protein